MPTPLDRALQSKSAFFGFAGLVTAAAAWAIWGPGQMFPPEGDPTGDPENWTREELRRWLDRRGLVPSPSATREELLERVKDNTKR